MCICVAIEFCVSYYKYFKTLYFYFTKKQLIEIDHIFIYIYIYIVYK